MVKWTGRKKKNEQIVDEWAELIAHDDGDGDGDGDGDDGVSDHFDSVGANGLG